MRADDIEINFWGIIIIVKLGRLLKSMIDNLLSGWVVKADNFNI